MQLALRVREGDLSHLQHNEFGVPRDSIGHTGVVGFVEASVSGSLRRPRELNSVGSLWIYPPLPIISDREEPRESKAEASEEPLESKAEACEYRVGPVEEDHEQAAEFERLKSDSEGDDEQAGAFPSHTTALHKLLSQRLRNVRCTGHLGALRCLTCGLTVRIVSSIRR